MSMPEDKTLELQEKAAELAAKIAEQRNLIRQEEEKLAQLEAQEKVVRNSLNLKLRKKQPQNNLNPHSED